MVCEGEKLFVKPNTNNIQTWETPKIGFSPGVSHKEHLKKGKTSTHQFGPAKLIP